eukprot:4216803-Amphidinium_carterae.1
MAILARRVDHYGLHQLVERFISINMVSHTAILVQRDGGREKLRPNATMSRPIQTLFYCNTFLSRARGFGLQVQIP